MAERDLGRSGRHAGGPSPTPAEGALAGETRYALRRVGRAGQRRRWAVEGLTVFACLVALVSYLGSEPEPEPERREGQAVLPAGTPTAADGPATPSPGAAEPGVSPSGAAPGLRPRQRPPSPTPSPAPVRTTKPPPRPFFVVARSDVPAVVNLTAAGTRDWVHWGLRGPDSVVRKRGGSGEIRDEGGRGGRESYDMNPESFSWRDGSPVESVGGTPTGVYAHGVGNGFALAVTGSGEPRVVLLHAGLWMARGRLDVRLSSGGPTTTLRMEDPHTSQTALFTIRFLAPRGTKLLMNWTTEATFDGYGVVGLQAVALR